MQQSTGLVKCKFCNQKFNQMEMFGHRQECNQQNHPEYISNIQSNIQQENEQSKIEKQSNIKINVPQPSQLSPQQKPSQIQHPSRFVPAQQNNNEQQQQSVIISYMNNKQEVPLQSQQSQIHNQYPYTDSLIQGTVQKCEYCQEDFPKDSLEEHLKVCESLQSLQQIQDDVYNEQPFEDDHQPRYENSQTEILLEDGTIKQTTIRVNPITGQRTEQIALINPRTNARIVQTTTTHENLNRNPYNIPRFPPMPQPRQQNIFSIPPPPLINFESRHPFTGNSFETRPPFNRNFPRNNLLDQFLKDLFGDHQYEEIQEHLTVIKYTPFQSLSDEHKQCNICFSEYEDGEELILLPCLHRFHKECIKKWFEEQLTCPICKLDIRKQLLPFEGEVDEDDI